MSAFGKLFHGALECSFRQGFDLGFIFFVSSLCVVVHQILGHDLSVMDWLYATKELFMLCDLVQILNYECFFVLLALTPVCELLLFLVLLIKNLYLIQLSVVKINSLLKPMMWRSVNDVVAQALIRIYLSAAFDQRWLTLNCRPNLLVFGVRPCLSLTQHRSSVTQCGALWFVLSNVEFATVLFGRRWLQQFLQWCIALTLI